jgi:hypothetical protein
MKYEISHTRKRLAARGAVLAIQAGLLLATASPTAFGAARCHTGDGAEFATGVPAVGAPMRSAVWHLSNGLVVDVVGEASLRARLTTRDGVPIIPLDGGRYLPVITDVADPAIYNKGDGAFHAFPEHIVASAFQAVAHPYMRVRLTVYILPYPRRNILVSSTSGTEIFLSPHVLDIHPAVGAYIIAHEAGHAFHNGYLPGGSPRWDAYRRVRGITDPYRFSETANHAYRPREIFAEDFRVLFGGELAAFGGRVENPELAEPRTVPGLEAFFLSLGGTVAREPEVVATSYPNPFNPETEIRVELPYEARGAGVSVRIVDVRGALVATLFEGRAASDRLVLRWDGTDRRGTKVASANYFAVIRAGNARKTLKLVMLK